MAKRGLTSLTAVSLILTFLCFTAGQSVEIAHPIEEGTRADHAHPARGSGLDLVCVQGADHHHFCLHQQSLAPRIDPPELIPQLTRRVDLPSSGGLAVFSVITDLRPRGPPAPLSA